MNRRSANASAVFFVKKRADINSCGIFDLRLASPLMDERAHHLEPSVESRGTFLTVMAVLFVVLAISDFTKALQYADDPSVGGLVVLGHKFQGVAKNLILGPILGIFLLI